MSHRPASPRNLVRWNAACRRSAVCRVASFVARSLSGTDSRIGSWLATHPPRPAFERATSVASTSALLATVDRMFVAASDAWQKSATRRVVVDRGPGRLEPWQRIRAVGLTVVTAAIGRAIMAPEVLAGDWLIRIAWCLIVFVGAFLFFACRPVGLAWTGWRRQGRRTD